MDSRLILICFLTFIIDLIGTLAYAARIAGVRTKRIAASFAIFNILVLVSRTSNSFQGPLLAKRVENSLALSSGHNLLFDFRCLLLSATLGTLVGALLTPSFQRVFSRAVESFQRHRSVLRLIMRGFSQGGLARLKGSLTLPSPAALSGLPQARAVSAPMILLNTGMVAIWAVGVLAALYAGYLHPELRLTSSYLSSIVNGVATILLFILVDPYISLMTEDVIEGKLSEAEFRGGIVWLIGSRFVGTLLAQALLVPAAALILFVAERL